MCAATKCCWYPSCLSSALRTHQAVLNVLLFQSVYSRTCSGKSEDLDNPFGCAVEEITWLSMSLHHVSRCILKQGEGTFHSFPPWGLTCNYLENLWDQGGKMTKHEQVLEPNIMLNIICATRWDGEKVIAWDNSLGRVSGKHLVSAKEPYSNNDHFQWTRG